MHDRFMYKYINKQNNPFCNKLELLVKSLDTKVFKLIKERSSLWKVGSRVELYLWLNIFNQSKKQI